MAQRQDPRPDDDGPRLIQRQNRRKPPWRAKVMTLMQFENGYRHGKRDYCSGVRSYALRLERSDYADGYRAGLKESETIQAKWLEAETGRIAPIPR
jgi:hypothetical protein